MNVFGTHLPAAYDSILQSHGQLHSKPVQVRDVVEAWRLGREHYSHAISGVVCREGSASSSPHEPLEKTIR